ncbi:MAG: sugar ABC transporter permease [Aggregatilineales bacterium]
MSGINPTSGASIASGAAPNTSSSPTSVAAYVRGYINRVRSGDIGSLPIVFGLVLIALIFQAANQNFLTPHNLVNLIVQMAGITAIAYGVVYVLLLGEIDLSVGFVSAVAGVSMTILMLPSSANNPDPTHWIVALSVLLFVALIVIWWAIRRFVVKTGSVGQRVGIQVLILTVIAVPASLLIAELIPALKPIAGVPWFIAIPVALITVGAIGILQGGLITTFQIPSFVVTLAGLLGWNGVVLLIIGNGGTVIIQDPTVNAIADSFLPPAWGWIAAIVAVGLFGLNRILRVQERRRRGLKVPPMGIVIAQIVILALLAALIVWIANQDADPSRGLQRGVPVIGVILLIMVAGLTFLAEQTRFGRYVYAIGGNKEAARRAGISVERIRIIVFMISSFMAGVGGIILASRLRSVDTNAGGGNLLLNAIASAVIGGTSLFGGRGQVSNAILGALIIAMIENGMGLLGLSAGLQFIITGLVLLVAVIVDAVSRSTQKRSGLA